MTAAHSTGNKYTVDEVGRRMEKIEEGLEKLGSSLHRRLDDLNYVNPETLDTKLMIEAALRAGLERRVGELEAKDEKREEEAATNRRLAVGGILTGLVLPVLVIVIVTNMGLR